MPKFKFNPRTGMMEPEVITEPVRVYKVMGGAKVEDLKRHISFIILRQSDTIQYTAGFDVKRFGVHLFTPRDAMKIADSVRRILPNTKYKDWEFFAVGKGDPDAELNEDDWFDVKTAQTTQGHTDFAKPNAKHKNGKITTGIRGALNALPSLAISTAICWPVMLINLLGSIHIRAEKRWLHSMINPNNWKDFIQTPAEGRTKPMTQREFDMLSQSEKEAYLKEQLKNNNRFYYAILSNGDCMLVIGPHKTDAEDMAKEMVKALESTYNELENKSKLQNAKLFRVHLDNGEIYSWVAADKQQAEQEVRDNKAMLNKLYNEWDKNFSHSAEHRNHPKYKGRMIDPKKLPIAEFTEDLGEIKYKKPKENEIRIEENAVDVNDGLAGNNYPFYGFKNFAVVMKDKDADSAAKQLGYFLSSGTFADIQKFQKLCLHDSNRRTYRACVQCGDEFILHVSAAEFKKKYPEEYNKILRRFKNKADYDSLNADEQKEFDIDVVEFMVDRLEQVIINGESRVKNHNSICGKRKADIEGEIKDYDHADWNHPKTLIEAGDRSKSYYLETPSDDKAKYIVRNSDNTEDINSVEQEIAYAA